MKKKYIIALAILVFSLNGLVGQIMNIDNLGNIILKPANVARSIYITEDYDEPQMYPSVSGYGYIGTGSNYWWRVTTRNIYRTNEYNLSDSTVKENIKPLKDILEKLMKVNGIQFDYNEHAFKNEPLEKKKILIENGKNSYGFTAQNLMEIFPNMVKKDDDGLLYISTDGLLPVLVEAIKEQQKQIETLQKIVAQHEEKLIDIEKSSSKLKSTDDINMEELGELAVLFQNSPNPFNQSTEIRYYLPNTIIKAMLNIYDLQGTQIKSINIQNRGSAAEIINGNELKPGLYLYTLIADGKEASTKRMILTE